MPIKAEEDHYVGMGLAQGRLQGRSGGWGESRSMPKLLSESAQLLSHTLLLFLCLQNCSHMKTQTFTL